MDVIKVDNLSKLFPINNVLALDNMKLSVKKGEIHAVVGENGAGKSTLMKILHGIESKDSGHIDITGKTGMVSQHFRLIEEFTILDNIIIGCEPKKHLFFLDRKKARFKVDNILEKYKFKLDIRKRVSELTIGQKQLVEIIKVIYKDGDILIFDEPTATLSDPETQKLRKTLLSLKDNNKTIVIISHKILDIEAISDRFTIMRNGKFINTVNTKDVNLKEISHYMSGNKTYKREVDLTLKGSTILKSKRYNFKLQEGEVLSFTGYGGCGLHELESYLENISKNRDDIGFIPSDRLGKGVDLNSKLSENLITSNLSKYSKLGFLQRKKISNYALKIINKYNIIGTPNAHTGLLSGGNIQKAIIGRTLESRPKILILSSPTWGIDNESSNFIYKTIDKFRKEGHGIILLSYDIQEVLKMSDRIFVMYKGEIIKKVTNNNSLTTKTLGHLCAGIL